MKYAPPGDQEDFYANMLLQCRNEQESAVIALLWRTGMHASTLCAGLWKCDSYKTGVYYHWFRPAKGFDDRPELRAVVPKSEHRVIQRCRAAGLLPASTSTLRRWVARIGDRAGYAAVSPLTFRHSRAVYLLDSGILPHRVSHLLGCSYEVLEKHYAQLEAERLVDKKKRSG